MSHPHYNVEQTNNKYIILHPKGQHLFSLVWLHGLGDSANGFSQVFLNPSLKIVPPTCKVILPTAPQRKVTCNGGVEMTSWYDIKALGGSNLTEDNCDQGEI